MGRGRAVSESVVYRVNIVYPGGESARFDWKHYLERHLPLAVGTSMRHTTVTGCDIDRPIATVPEPPYRCICTVYFDGGVSMERFRRLFTSGHPDTRAIKEDEPSYTDVHSRFVCAVAYRHDHGAVVSMKPASRLRVLIPAVGGERLDFERFRWDVEPTLVNRLAQHAPIPFTEIDRCTSGLASRSSPLYDVLWTLYFENTAAARIVADQLREGEDAQIVRALRDVVDLSASRALEMLTSEIVPFDLREVTSLRH